MPPPLPLDLETPPALRALGIVRPSHRPAGALLVRENGQTRIKETFGCAVPQVSECLAAADNDTPFAIASLSKHFTAALVLMLEEDGLLSCEDEIGRHLDLPAKFRGIRIRHLIFHTSGIPDYLDIDNKIANYDHPTDRIIRSGQALEIIEALPLQPCGIEMVYSNSGYLLLGKIVETATGLSFADLMRQRLFGPVGMVNSFANSERTAERRSVVPYLIHPHRKALLLDFYPDLGPEGGLFVSINDFEKWMIAFENGALFSNPSTMARFLSHGRLDNGMPNFFMDAYPPYRNAVYGYGLMRYDFSSGDALVTHSGSLGNVHANFIFNITKIYWHVRFDGESLDFSFQDVINNLALSRQESRI